MPGDARKKRSKQRLEVACDRFRERLDFLEAMYGWKVHYEVDYATGRASFRVTPAGSPVSLEVDSVDVEHFGIPEA